MDYTLSNDHVALIVSEAQRKQLEKPARAVVNSEAAFVAQRLRTEGHTDIASRYWSWTCRRGTEAEFGKEVYQLQQQLNAIDAGITMPEWGTYGT